MSGRHLTCTTTLQVASNCLSCFPCRSHRPSNVQVFWGINGLISHLLPSIPSSSSADGQKFLNLIMRHQSFLQHHQKICECRRGLYIPQSCHGLSDLTSCSSMLKEIVRVCWGILFTFISFFCLQEIDDEPLETLFLDNDNKLADSSFSVSLTSVFFNDCFHASDNWEGKTSDREMHRKHLFFNAHRSSLHWQQIRRVSPAIWNLLNPEQKVDADEKGVSTTQKKQIGTT